MTKDDKKLVRNVILFCIIFSVFFTAYRIFSLIEKKYEDNAKSDNITLPQPTINKVENNSTPKGYDNISGANILPDAKYEQQNINIQSNNHGLRHRPCCLR